MPEIIFQLRHEKNTHNAQQAFIIIPPLYVTYIAAFPYTWHWFNNSCKLKDTIWEQIIDLIMQHI